jgi:hypothetical protein
LIISTRSWSINTCLWWFISSSLINYYIFTFSSNNALWLVCTRSWIKFNLTIIKIALFSSSYPKYLTRNNSINVLMIAWIGAWPWYLSHWLWQIFDVSILTLYPLKFSKSSSTSYISKYSFLRIFTWTWAFPVCKTPCTLNCHSIFIYTLL